MMWISAVNDSGDLLKGITSEPLYFILALLFIVFSSQGLWGLLQKAIEKRKTKQEGNLDEKKLDFEIDKFSIETIQKAVITLNQDMVRLRTELSSTQTELATVRANYYSVLEKNAALLRYIAKAVSTRKNEGIELVQVDVADHYVIPEVVEMLK